MIRKRYFLKDWWPSSNLMSKICNPWWMTHSIALVTQFNIVGPIFGTISELKKDERSRWKTEEYINTESHRGSEHAASEPNGVPLHLVGDHLHVDRLRLKNRSQVKDTIGDMCGFRRRYYRSIFNTSYFNINLFSLTRHSPPMPKEPLPSGDSLIASHYHRQQSSLSLAQSTFSGIHMLHLFRRLLYWRRRFW